jgi:hypothetical protein
MIQGFITDYSHGAVQPAQWLEGPPQKSFWMGTKVAAKDLVPVGTFRCPSCGYLESYARPEFDRQ